jgi:hypothetical protein
MEVDVEVLDVTEEETRKLLLSIDPLAALAQTQEQLHERLRELTPADCPALEAVWEATAAVAPHQAREGGFVTLQGESLEQLAVGNVKRARRQVVEVAEEDVCLAHARIPREDLGCLYPIVARGDRGGSGFQQSFS